MSGLVQDLRYALRRLRHSPGFSAVAILSLGVGIGANTAVFNVVNGMLLRPLAFPHAYRTLMLFERGSAGTTSQTGFATFSDWRDRARSFDAMAAFSYWGPTLTGVDDPERLAGLHVSASFFDLLGVRPALGRSFLPSEDRPDHSRVAILNHELWQRRFAGDPGIVGKPIRLGSYDYTIVGVLPEGFETVFAMGSDEAPAEIWSPLGYSAELPQACRTCRHLRAIGRVAPGTSVAQATAELESVSAALFAEHPSDYAAAGIVAQAVQDFVVAGSRPLLLLLLACVALVLLIACVNLANLQLARVTASAGELSVRAALGASRARLLRQQLVESLLLSAGGALVGVALAALGTDALLASSPRPLPRPSAVRIDGSVLGFTAGVAVLAALVAGLAPALRATSTMPQRFLASVGRGTSHGQRVQRALVAVQVALSLALLASAGVLMRSLDRLLAVDPGFRVDNLISAEITVTGARYAEDAPTWGYFRRVVERAAALPGVRAAGVVSQLPLGGDFDMSGIHALDKPFANPSDAPSGDRYSVSPGYLDAMGIAVKRGRGLRNSDRAGATPVVLINEALARSYWPHEDPIGKRIQYGESTTPWREVVGVVADVRHHGLDKPAIPQFYVPMDQGPWADATMVLVARTAGEPGALGRTLRAAIAEVDPTLPVRKLRTLEATRSLSLADRRFATRVLGAFAGAAALLLAFGVFGVVQHAITQRTREIAIRMALGAGLGQVWSWVLRYGLKPAAAGLLVGLGLFAALARFLSGFVYGVAAMDPPTLAGVAVLTLLVAAAACVVPALRATRVDPLAVLRHE